MARHHHYRRDSHASARHPSAIAKYGPWALGAGVLAAIFWPRSAGAAQVQNEPAGTKATVHTGSGVKVHDAPSLSATTKGVLADGVVVTVLQEHITPTDNSGGEWWQIDGGGMTGFARAVDPAGGHNFLPGAQSGNAPAPAPAPAPTPDDQGDGTEPVFQGTQFGAYPSYDPRYRYHPRYGASAYHHGVRSPITRPHTFGAAAPAIERGGFVPRSAPHVSDRSFHPQQQHGGLRPGGLTWYAPEAYAVEAQNALVRCVAPSGCYLRVAQGGQLVPSGVVVENGAPLPALRSVPGPKTDPSSPSLGGWTLVTYSDRAAGRSYQGWLPSEWLVNA